MSLSILVNLLKSIDILVLERIEKCAYRVLGHPPDWFNLLFNEDAIKNESFDPGSKSPFLENFLIDAEEFWNTETFGRLSSGLWIETDQTGKEYPFKANALQVKKTKILLITLTSDSYTEKQYFLQKGRELSLAYSNLEKIQKKLSIAKKQAEFANYSKSIFLANMSHELRSPLNVIIGFTDLLAQRFFGELNEKQERYINNILEGSHFLLQLINDILDISKIEAGKMEICKTKIMIKGLLENSVNLINLKAIKKGITIDIQIPEEFACLEIMADEVKLKQIMYNLLSNAIKYTPEGGFVLIKLTKEDIYMLISVSDSGIGIKPEDQKAIFEEFTRIHSSYTSKEEGTGLGLSLTRKLVEMHNGKIWLESEGEGKGSNFSFSIPIS